MIEVILQHRDTGMFLVREGHWRDVSRDALIFSNAADAFRFAHEAEMGRDVRAVVRFREDKYHILMPLMDEAMPVARHQKRGG